MTGLMWTPNFIPQAKFAMPRSYFAGWRLCWDVSMTTISEGQETIVGAGIGLDFQWHIKFVDKWWNWNSNTYTPDFIFEEMYVHQVSSGLDFNVGIIDVSFPVFAGKPGFYIKLVTSFATPFLDFEFPVSPGPYWQLPLP